VDPTRAAGQGPRAGARPSRVLFFPTKVGCGHGSGAGLTKVAGDDTSRGARPPLRCLQPNVRRANPLAMAPYKLSTFDSRDAHAFTAFDLGSLLPSRRHGDRVRVLGHRGSVGPESPENSAAAVTEALLRGADGAEIDVWLTADGTLVCAHDLPSADVDTLSTLTDVLAAAQGADGFQLVVEAKPVADAAVASATAEALAAVLRAAAGTADITVSSFDAALLATIRAACGDLPVRTALLAKASTPAVPAVRRAHEAGHDEVHLSLAAVRRSPEAAELAHRLGMEIALWTVNRRTDLQWAAELGVDAVITDDVLTAWSELDRAATIREMAAV
jgi:glycerophosphoryl diester phosphodiesterase